MKRNLYALLLSLGLALPTLANHYSGGNILYNCLGNNQYEITLQLFVDCSGFAVIPQDLHFSSSCGTSFDVTGLPVAAGAEVSQLCPAQLENSTCNGGGLPGMELYEFTTTQFLSPCDGWTISWYLCCRAASINLVGSEGEYIETVLNSTTAACDNSPVFAEDALPYVCVGQTVNYNFGVSDPDGDSLSYSFIDARKWNGAAVPVTYQPGHFGAEPIPGITLDAATGQVTFTPTLIGYYIVALRVDAYNDAGELTGSVVRDILFVVIDCTNTNPDASSGTITNLTGPVTQTGEYSITVCGGSSFCFDAVIADPDALQALTLESNVATVLPGAQFGTIGENPATATVCWDAGGMPPGTYVFTVNATDDACPQPALLILTYAITVLDAPDAGENAFVTVCSTDPPFPLFEVLGGDPDPGGTFTQVLPGVYHYVVPGIGDCAADSSVVVVTTVLAADAGFDNSIVVCENGELVFMYDSLLGTPTPGGIWTNPLGNPQAPFFDPISDPPGIYCYVLAGTPPCADAIACLTITVIDASDPACLNTSVSGLSKVDPTLFPNPNNGSFTFANMDGLQRVEVLDALGRPVVVIVPTAQDPLRIELHSTFADGRYVLRMISHDDVRTIPFEVVH